MGKSPTTPDGTFRAIGLMSGTSMDGIDVALIETDGEYRVDRGMNATVAYPAEFRARLRQALDDARRLSDRNDRPGCLAEVERELTERHAEVVSRFLGQHGLQPTAIDCIGFHGQTVLHRPAAAIAVGPRNGVARPGRSQTLTVQIGDGPALAAMTGIDVVHDLRAADTEAGGQGAPLVPVYHRALVARLEARPIAVVNVGGVANVTWIGRDGRLVAFDTGPGNALLDDWIHASTGAAFDVDGAIAARGRTDDDTLESLLMHEYFSVPPPKSLDRNTFALPMRLRHAGASDRRSDVVVASDENGSPASLSLEDGAATLTAFTAAAVAKSRAHMPEEPQLWIICGGGRRNRTLMEALAGHVHHAVVPAEAVGLDGDSLEAEAWAYLAVRSLKGLPITFTGTTGVATPMPGGVFSPAPVLRD